MTKNRVNPLLEQLRRQQEQDKLVEQAMQTEKTNDRKVKLTLSLSEADVLKVKKLALDRRTTVSQLLSDWIRAEQ